MVGIQLNTSTVQLWVKLPASPDQLRLQGERANDPYPQLVSHWDRMNKQWEWEIPTIEAVPDASLAIDLARLHHG